MKYTLDRLALHLFVVSAAFLVFAYGVAVGIFEVFPFRILVNAAGGAQALAVRCKMTLPEYYSRVKSPYPPAIRNTGRAYQGLNLVAEMAANCTLLAKIMDMDGRTVHQWKLDWFKIWPDAKHVPARLLPQSPPGTAISDALVTNNGDLIFSFGNLGLVRLDSQGNVVWRLPYQTHHLIEWGDDGNLWVCGNKDHTQPSPRFPHIIPPFQEAMILVVTPEGKIVREWSIVDLLQKNGLIGLLYLSTWQELSTQIPGEIFTRDVLHLNDVEPFPAGLKEGFFKKGDVLVSLRNVNTVFVFNQESEKIKFICTGQFIGQHDPDFIDGNTFSVFDNNRANRERDPPQSRIVIISRPTKK